MDENASVGWSGAISDIFSKGLEGASQVLQAKYRANDPTLNSVGPNGQVAAYGQRGTFTQQLSTVSPLIWIGGAAAIVVLAVVLMRR
jgi:hypothetical protein